MHICGCFRYVERLAVHGPLDPYRSLKTGEKELVQSMAAKVLRSINDAHVLQGAKLRSGEEAEGTEKPRRSVIIRANVMLIFQH